MASYGQRTSGQLLLSYGFAPSAGENPHDACLLELSISEQDPLREAKLQALQGYGLGASQVGNLEPSPTPSNPYTFKRCCMHRAWPLPKVALPSFLDHVVL